MTPHSHPRHDTADLEKRKMLPGRFTLKMLRPAGLVLTVMLATACGGAAQTASAPAGGLALVVGAHANAPQPQLTDDTAHEVLAAAESGARAAVVLNSGTPQVVLEQSMGSTAKNDYARGKDSEKAALAVAEAVRSSRAATEETNLLAALDQAARSITDVQGPMTLLVIDSGLQTTGALRFQEPGMLTADPAETASYLAETGALPDLEGTRVIFSGLGDTAPPQTPLSPAQRKNLVALWTAIATAAGATSTEVLDAPLSGPPLAQLPAVTTVDVPPPAPPTPRTKEPIALTEETVAFQPASAEYRDPQAAADALRPLAQQILADGAAVHLTGTTSSAGTVEGRRRLSLLRAETVKRSLVELGVPADRITTEGLGSDWPGYVTDRDTQGVLLPGPAAQNRSVLLQASR